MYHWIRDCRVDDGGEADNSGFGECNFLIYHFLRTAGWEWLWECDGVVENHCPDANMEDGDILSWTGIGGGPPVLTKVTPHHMGTQGLSIESNALNDGVQSLALTSMTAAVAYKLVIWAANATASPWDVGVDNGSGAFGSVGAIPPNAGVWTKHVFSFTVDPAPGNVYWRARDTANTQGTIYLDSIMVFRSWFEYNGVDAEDLSGSPDGQILNGNEFHSGSYSFVAGDIGKYICVWDTTNLGNSGAYKIIGINGTDAQLDLRAGGAPVLVAQTGLRWRLIDITTAARIYDPGQTTELYAGWGLESPHAEHWRFFCRNNWTTSSDRSWLTTWSAPYDADFDVETGDFLVTEASTHNIRGNYGKGAPGTNTVPRGFHIGGYIASPTNTYRRVYLMTDDDGTALFIALRPGDGVQADSEGACLVGFSGSDAAHTTRQSFIHFGAISMATDGAAITWTTNLDYRLPYYGAQCGSIGKGWMVDSKIMILGFGGTTMDEKVYASPRVNPFNGEHFLRKLTLARDYTGAESNNPTEKTLDTLGLRNGLAATTIYTAIDSNTVLHLREGVFMDLPSSAGVGLFPPLV